MGWVALAAIGAAAMAVFLAWRSARGVWMVFAAALFLGASGYALQQRASLPGHPVAPDAEAIEVDPGLVAFRSAIMPASAIDTATLAGADERLRAGAPRQAVQALLKALDRRPDDAVLWTGLGSAIAAHDGAQMSPAALFAFRRAVSLAPDAPGPPFFLGLAYVQAGELGPAKIAWLRALALAPRNARYRVDIAERLVMIDEFAAMAARGGMPR